VSFLISGGVMKALTIKNPWAGLILLGMKDVENRTWKTDYRGKLLIHSSKSKKDLRENEDYIARNILTQEEYDSLSKNINAQTVCRSFGKIIGEIELVDCVQNYQKKEEGVWHWVLKNPIIYDRFIEAKGKLSLWTYEEKAQEERNNEKI
jgi:hypothetical protein